MDKLRIEGLSCGYGDVPVVEDVHMAIPPGVFAGVIGPNGSGKSTLLKAVYGAIEPKCGSILLDGVDISRMSAKARARKLAAVGQENTVPFNFTVEEIVMMGRTPYKRLLEGDNEADRRAVARALEQAGVGALRRRMYAELSGGEKQRVMIARALAQETDFIVLDEPTNHLDIAHQLQILGTLRQTRMTVLAAIHDLNLAMMYCDLVYVLNDGRIVSEGAPKEVLTERLIREVFHVECGVEPAMRAGRDVIVYYSGETEARP